MFLHIFDPRVLHEKSLPALSYRNTLYIRVQIDTVYPVESMQSNKFFTLSLW